MKFPIIKTSISSVELHPYSPSDVPFMITLLNSASIAKTLFREEKKTTEEKQQKALDKMHDEKRPKEITYVIKIRKLLSLTPIGYVKIKIIDWTNMSCYLSTAILDDGNYRGKGYATASYNAFFTFLFELGFLKIYGRTYETNDATIALNEATGFRFIGRQKHFVLHTGKQDLDALFFERINDSLAPQYKKSYEQSNKMLTNLAAHVAQGKAEMSQFCKELESAPYFNKTYSSYASYLRQQQPEQEAVTINSSHKNVTFESLNALFAQHSIPGTLQQADTITVDWDALTISCPATIRDTDAISLTLSLMRYSNAVHARHELFGIPIISDQQNTLKKMSATLQSIVSGGNDWEIFDERLLYGNAVTEKNVRFLSRCFLGIPLNVTFMQMLAIAAQIERSAS